MLAKYELLVGQHEQGGVVYDVRSNKFIETEHDLVAAFGPLKFRKVEGWVPPQEKAPVPGHVAHSAPAADPPEDNEPEQTEENDEETGEEAGDELGKLTVAELRKFADDNEIDLTGCTKKDEILNTIRNAMGE